MRPLRPLLCVAVLSLGLSACTLRPYYRQVLPPEASRLKPQEARGMEDVLVRVMEPGLNRPISGARVLVGTGRERVNVTSDVNGFVRLPVTPELLAENPLVEVILPPGVRGYALELVRLEPQPQPSSEPVPQPSSEPVPQPSSEPEPQPPQG